MAEPGMQLSPQEKISRARSLYDAFGRGDLAAVMEGWSDDITFHSRGSTRYGGDFHGKEEAVRFLSMIAEDFEEFRLDLHDILANDEHVVVLANQTAKRHGES